MKALLRVMMLSFSLLLSNAIFAAGSAPNFDLDGVDGKVKLSDYQGKVVYLDFWASWCGPCRKSFPWMNEMQSRFEKKGFRVIAVNLDIKRADADKFLAQLKPNFDIAFDPQGAVAGLYELQGMPSAYLIDRGGNLHSVHQGFRNRDISVLEGEIKALLNSGKTKIR